MFLTLGSLKKIFFETILGARDPKPVEIKNASDSAPDFLSSNKKHADAYDFTTIRPGFTKKPTPHGEI